MSADNIAIAKELVATLDRAVLATSMPDDGWPYASLVLVAIDPGGAPLLLLSGLAQHTVNLAAEPRASLLLDGTAGLDEPLTGPRLTLLGRISRTDDAAALERFVARHPGASLYAGFADFALYRMTIERGHLVAGFGRICWLSADSLRPAE